MRIRQEAAAPVICRHFFICRPYSRRHPEYNRSWTTDVQSGESMLRLFATLIGMLSFCFPAGSLALPGGERAEVRATAPLADGDIAVGWKDFKPWIARRNGKGNLLWEKAAGEEGGRFNAVAAVTGGGIVAAGAANIQVGPAWAAGFDADGKLLWTRHLGKNNSYAAGAIAALPEGGVVLAGGESSGAATARWAARLDAHGGLVWYRTFDGEDNRGTASSIALLPGGAILIAGQRWHGLHVRGVPFGRAVGGASRRRRRRPSGQRTSAKLSNPVRRTCGPISCCARRRQLPAAALR